MRILSATFVAIIMLTVTTRYCWLTITGETDPVFSGWLVVTVSVGLAFWTYCKTERHNWVDNICNTVDLFLTTTVLLVICLFGQNVRLGFSWFDMATFAGAGLVLAYWWQSKNAFRANLAIQVLMGIGYIPLTIRVMFAKTNPEPWSVWVPVWVACIFALIPAFFPREKPREWEDAFLPRVYSVRAVVSVTILLILMLRLEVINH